jgi:signal transduction histidine kinase
MTSPAPHVSHGDRHQNGYFKGRVSPETSVQVVADDRVRSSRSALCTIGWVLLVVLVTGATVAVLAIWNDAVIPSTMALAVIVVTVAVALAALISAMVVARKAFAVEGDTSPRVGVEEREDRPEPRRTTETSDDVGRSEPSAGQWEPEKAGTEQNHEVFSRIASRLQAKVARSFVDLDTLERSIEDPELLATVFSLDHLVTRIRREVENLSVLGGDAPPSRSSQPAEVNQVLRLAVASTEDYQRIMTFPLRGTKIHGHVVAELINLLAELLDNATTFTPPQAPKISLSASRVAAGLAIEVHDRGIGMPPEDIERVNRLLSGHADVDLHQLLGEGRIGFAVVNKLAPRHNIRVELRTNIFGGINAAVVIPHNLLSEPEEQYGAAHARPSSMRLEPGTARAPSTLTAAEQTRPRSQPGDWPPDGRRSGPPAVAAVGKQPSPFPRSPVRQDVRNDPRSPWKAPGEAGSTVAAPPAERPPLPQRGSATYLRPELREPPRITRTSPGHNPDLLVDVIRGREDAELENSDGGQ